MHQVRETDKMDRQTRYNEILETKIPLDLLSDIDEYVFQNKVCVCCVLARVCERAVAVCVCVCVCQRFCVCMTAHKCWCDAEGKTVHHTMHDPQDTIETTLAKQ